MKIKKTVIGFVIIAVLGFLFPSCNGHSNGSMDMEWRKALMEERQEKDHEFKTSPTSPMAGVERFTIKAGKEMFLLENNGNITLSEKKESGVQFSIMGKEGRWYWESHNPVITCTTGNKEVIAGSPLPGRAIFKVGSFTVVGYTLTDAITMLVFDPTRRQLREFSHLYYFPPVRKYAVSVIIEKFAAIKKLKMLTSRSLEKTFYRYARIRFHLHGKSLQLTAYKFSLDSQNPGSKFLFIPFNDTTNGKETYGIGRFLEIHEPQSKEFILDFNRCFNPLCNYAPVYNCPIPPLENNLEIPIKAGEKTYQH